MGLSRDFLALLKARPQWEAFTGEDQWGNNTWAAPVTIEAYVGNLTRAPGQQDSQGQQDATVIETVTLMTDYKGISVKDRLTLPTGEVVHVSEASVGHDEAGAALYQNITAVSTPRG